MGRDELVHQVTRGPNLLWRKVKQGGQGAAVGKLGARLSELVEEGVGARLEGGNALVGGVDEELGHEVDGLGRRLGAKHLGLGPKHIRHVDSSRVLIYSSSGGKISWGLMDSYFDQDFVVLMDSYFGESVHLAPGVRLDLRKLELCVVLVHRLDLFAGGGPDNLDYLDKLVNIALSGEEGESKQQLGEDATGKEDKFFGIKK